MKISAQLSQSQHLKLTPQLQMAIKLLQYSSLELEQEIELAIESNPFLERVNELQSEPTALPDTQLQAAEEQHEWQENLSIASGLERANHSGAESALEWVAETRSLRTHLLEQLQLCSISPRDAIIGEALIDNLNDDGYLACGFQEIRSGASLKPEPNDAEIEAVLHLIQQFDPLAVASRNLSECLLLQLQHIVADKDIVALAMQITSQHLNVLATSGAMGIVNILGSDAWLTAQAVGLLKTLDPKPGAAFSSVRVEYVRPDYRVEKLAGRWKIQALVDDRQHLVINSFYQSLIGRTSSQDNAYLKQNLQEANWLIKSIQSRQLTIKRVVTAIVALQKPFLEHGIAKLNVMTMKDIAQQLALHESSISRACSGKYLATPHGSFELNTLFRSGIANAQGQMLSSSAIQSQIAALIQHENPAKPLSDAQLVVLLQEQGLNIARRTVAKYREALNLPASHLRQKSA
jgi:RNA polymerase sigma-54 factor